MEVFTDLGGGDEIVGLIQGFWIGLVKGVIQSDGMAHFLEHYRESWAGATTVIKAVTLGG